MSDDARISEIADHWYSGERARDDVRYLLARVDALTAGRDAATKRVATLENDLEHALASVGAFRQAIEDVWAKSAGESGDDGFIVSYVIPVGVLHRAIGLARGTDAGGKLLTRLAASEAALRGMLESYEMCMGSEVAFSPLTRDMLRGMFIFEPERARAALAAASEGA